jgi:hypothetical protein
MGNDMTKPELAPNEVKFTRKKFIFPDGRVDWCVSCTHGSISFWFVELSDDKKLSYGEKGYGGVEVHYNEKSKPEYLSEGSYHEQCLQNNGKCWHDGSSLWAIEYWIPYVMPKGDDSIWRKLESTALERFFKEKDDE